MHEKFHNLTQRSITGLIIVPIMLLITYYGGVIYTIFILSISILSIRELILMTNKEYKMWKYWFISTITCIVIFFLNMIALRNHSLQATIFLLLIVWITDTSAYFGGITFGGKKILPIISPKKTWSGLICALLSSGVLSCISYLLDFLLLSNNMIHSILNGMLISLISQVGDFYESGLKRYFNVKDSGKLLPGHGGILDRFDGMIFASFAIVMIIF